jgi:hypothetical protein
MERNPENSSPSTPKPATEFSHEPIVSFPGHTTSFTKTYLNRILSYLILGLPSDRLPWDFLNKILGAFWTTSQAHHKGNKIIKSEFKTHFFLVCQHRFTRYILTQWWSLSGAFQEKESKTTYYFCNLFVNNRTQSTWPIDSGFHWVILRAIWFKSVEQS